MLDSGLFYIDNNGEKHFLECNRYNLSNIKNSVLIEYNKFLKDKKNYIKEHNICYDVI